ncbi:MAG: Jag N-terminal domain-containing protein [Acidimicrobiia bacterium]|nr:Jag N-terminal domain-containing protein [Acidimicrobiia bacterium]
MEWIEITASSEHEALDRALDELGVHRDEAEWEVIEVSKARLGGLLGRSEARIRARIKPVSREKPQTSRDRSRGGRSSGGKGRRGDGNKGNGRRGNKQTGRGKGAQQQSGNKQEDRKQGGGKSENADKDGPRDGNRRGGDGRSGTKSSAQDRDRTRPGQNRSGRRGGATAPGSRRRAGSDRPDSGNGDRDRRDEASGRKARGGERGGAPVNEGPDRDEESVPIDEQADIAEDFVAGLVEAFDVDADIGVDADDEDWVLQITVEGSELGLLVGRGGATITAIEELTRTVLQRRTGGQAARVRVDVGGYRAARRKALEEFARSLIDKVRETGRAQELEPMSAADRKVVHGVAAEDDDVTTSSEGEEPRRRVVIHPA